MSDKLQKLLEIANQKPTEPKPVREDNEAEKFIKHFSIEEGTAVVPAIVIYDKYKSWKKDKAIEMRLFFKMFKKYFKKKQTARGANYLVNPKHFDTSEENLWKVKRHLRRDYENRYGKKEEQQEKEHQKDEKKD